MTDDVIWKDSAREEVRDIYSYLFDVSPKIAENWADELAKKLRYVAQFPEMGRIVPDYQISEISTISWIRYTMESLDKQKVIGYLNEMPDTFSTEEMLDRILTLSKIEKGLQDVEAGRTKSHEDVVTKFRQWQQR
jgi:toxin ParE1/3/4